MFSFKGGHNAIAEDVVLKRNLVVSEKFFGEIPTKARVNLECERKQHDLDERQNDLIVYFTAHGVVQL